MKMKLVGFSMVLGILTAVLNQMSVFADDSSTVRLSLQNTGLVPNANGMVLLTLKSKNSLFSITAAGLTPSNAYTLNVGAVPEATLTADSKGRVRAQFISPAKNGNLPLNFNPQGQIVSLDNGTNAILQAMLSAAGEPAGVSEDERVTLSSPSGSAQASLRYQAQKSGSRAFTVQLKNAPGANWSLFVDGIFRGTIPTQKSSGKIVFSSNGSPALDFDPRGKVIDIAQDTNVVFSGELEAQIQNVSVASPSVSVASIPSTGIAPDGTANARLRTDRDATRHFTVDVENVPVGSYQLLAEGNLEGIVNVTSDGGESEGEIEFSSSPDDGDELPLTFDPTNTTFTIQQSNTVYFQGGLVFAAGLGTNTPVTIDESLVSGSIDPSAKGDARFEIDNQGRSKFRVEIENVLAGAYQLWVGGVQRGIINASAVSSEVSGEIEFGNPKDSSEEQLLNFDPRGQLLEVKNDTNTFFSQIFGSGDTNNTLTVPLQVDLPLFNIGPATNGTAEAKFKQDDQNQQSFEVEIDNVPAGDYQLLVGGVVQATISVIQNSGETQGRVEFETEPQGGSLPLNFNPLGQDVSVVQDGIIYFDRTLPSN